MRIPLEVVMASAQPKPDFERLWGREDSNLRRLSRRVYSPFPLAARAHPQGAANCSLGRLERFDAIVVGAGPAGSTTAYRLARAGARVLVLERARFPRDKPCGGGLTERALRQLPFSVDPVVEETVDTLEARLRYGPRFERRSGSRLAVMTQRRRLDAYLTQQAGAARAEVPGGARGAGGPHAARTARQALRRARDRPRGRHRPARLPPADAAAVGRARARP